MSGINLSLGTAAASIEAVHNNSANTKPEFFRLPKPGARDPFFGLSRTGIYELENEGKIRLLRLRKRGALRGTTLVPFDAMLKYLRSLETSEKEAA